MSAGQWSVDGFRDPTTLADPRSVPKRDVGDAYQPVLVVVGLTPLVTRLFFSPWIFFSGRSRASPFSSRDGSSRDPSRHRTVLSPTRDCIYQFSIFGTRGARQRSDTRRDASVTGTTNLSPRHFA